MADRSTRPRGIFWKLLLIVVVDAMALGVLAKAILSETRTTDAIVNAIADLRDPSPFRVALRGHLEKIRLNVSGYFYTRDAALPPQIAESEKDFERLLPDFERQNPKLLPAAAAADILQAFETLKASVDWALQVTTQRAEKWQAAEANFAHMLSFIDQRVAPLSREGRPNAEPRRDALLDFENQLRAREKALTQSWSDPTAANPSADAEFEYRGQTALDLYGRIIEQARERDLLHTLRLLWDQTGALVRASDALANVQTQALTRMKADREIVDQVLNRRLPAMHPGDLEAKKQVMMHSLREHTLYAGLWVLAGIGLLAMSGLLGYRVCRPPAVPSSTAAAAPEEPTIVIGADGAITAWSPTAERLYGYAAWEITGQSLSKLFASESEIQRLWKQLSSAKESHGETIHLTKAGTAFPVRIDFRPLADGAGRSAGIGLFCKRR